MKNPHRGEIHLLPEHIVDQIKAGEVIERPATLLKELIENSIDANANQIKIQIINNGLDLIAVEDNGKGISFQDLPLAFCRHATSKIQIFEDLYHLKSYGFRGEALASMASVSKLTCISKPENAAEGMIKFHGGEIVSQRQEAESSSVSGTKIYVKDLFYNTPVRMKFLQSQTSEKNQIKKIINAFVLTHPKIEFTVKWDESPKDFFPSILKQDIEKRIKALFEKKKDPLSLVHFQDEYDGIHVEGTLSLNSTKSNAGKFHYIFINDRFVQDIQIHKIIIHTAQNLWPSGLSGNYVVYIQIPSDQLDVNVHPNKTVIKLFQSSKVFSILSSSIKKHLPKSKIDSFSDGYHINTNLALPQNGIDFKDVTYRFKDFTESSTLDNYFAHLDNKTFNNLDNDNKEWHLLLKSSEIILAKRDESIYLFAKKLLMKIYVEFLLNKMNDFSPVPLLVSTPLKLDLNLAKSSERLKRLHQLGFEVDSIGDNALVLRSFPKCLSHLPYIEIAKDLISNLNEKNDSISLSSSFEAEFNMNSTTFNQIITQMGLVEIINLRACKILLEKELLNLI